MGAPSGVQFRPVPFKARGHVNILGNELADALAQSNFNKFKKLILNNNIKVIGEDIYGINL